MTYEDFNRYCGSLPATEHLIQWGGAHVWKVDAKVFAIGGWEKAENQPAFTFKTSELDFEILKDEPGFRPAPYMASRGMKWIQQYRVPQETEETLKHYLESSYRMVAGALSKKKQRELGLNL